MNPTLLWLLVGLGAVVLVTWRLVVSSRRKDAQTAARASAAEVALAQARRAAAPAIATTPAGTAAPAAPVAVAATLVAPAPPQPAATPVAPAGAHPAAVIATPVAAGPPGGIERRSPGRLAADRVIAAEAARRQVELQKVQDAARAAAERRKLEAARLATTQPITPATAPAIPAAAPTVVALRAPVAAGSADAARSFAPATSIPRGAAAPAAHAKTPGETVILVVDDSKMVRLKTSKLLVAHGYQVVTAIDGQDGISQLETCQPDLVISDVDMPVLDGFGLATHLRRTPRTAHVPIVMITSAEDRHREEALRIGVGLVMGKPYPEDELLAHIRSFSFAAQAVREPASALA